MLPTSVLIENLVAACKTLLPLATVSSYLPVLNNFKLVADTEGLHITATNIENYGTSHLEAACGTPFETCVDAKLLTAWLSQKKASGRLDLDYNKGIPAQYEETPCSHCVLGTIECTTCHGKGKYFPAYSRNNTEVTCTRCTFGQTKCIYCHGTGIDKKTIDPGKPPVLNLTFGNRRASLPTLSVDEFPTILKNYTMKGLFVLTPVEFKTAFNAVLSAAATEDKRPILQSLEVKIQNDQLTVAATDGYRLHIYKQPLAQLKIDPILIPANTLTYLLKQIPAKSKDDIVFMIYSDRLAVQFKKTDWNCQLTEGKYPDYQQVIPKVETTDISFNRAALLSNLETLKLYFKEHKALKLSFFNNTLTLMASTVELGSSEVDLEIVWDRDRQEIQINYDYVLDALRALSGERVILKVINQNNPIGFEDDHLYALMMPVSVS